MCGIIGVYHPKDGQYNNQAAYDCYRGLLTLQHRGQDACGLLCYDSLHHRFRLERDLGLVSNVIDEKNIKKLEGEIAIGHVRYPTNGSDEQGDLQPVVTGYPFGLGMAHNGNLVNYHQLLREMQSEDQIQFLTHNDLEVLQTIWYQHFVRAEGDFTFAGAIKAVERIFDKAIGGYSVVGLMAELGLFAFRDPNGIRPLVLGRKRAGDRYSYSLSSETVALSFIGHEFVRDLAPGELILIDLQGEIHSYVVAKKIFRPCMFEWVYFSAAEGKIEGRSVYETRLNLGRRLALKAKKLIESGEISPETVSPVPDTSRTASISLAEELGLPYREVLIKNRYVQRSFILSSQEKREKAVELKLGPVRSEIEGKSILLVDDSIVRGTTAKKIVSLLKKYGAKQITLAITCPPIRYPCFYGIDFPDPDELIAFNKTEDEMAAWMGVDKVIFLDKEDLKNAIKLDDPCMACIDGRYPTSIESGDEFMKKRNIYK